MTDSLSDLSAGENSSSQRGAVPADPPVVRSESNPSAAGHESGLARDSTAGGSHPRSFPTVTSPGEGSHASRSGRESGSSPEISPDEMTVISQTQDFAASRADVAALEGRLVGHFELKQFLGGGGMGIVFRAFDSVLSRSVAIKLLPRGGTKAETIQRFQVEARSAARLDHPNIARVFQVGSDEACDYIIFEFVEGDNLSQLVRRIGPLPYDLALRYTFQLALAIQHAYQRGVVHRDIKPANVVVTDGGKLKLIDLGLARSPKANENDNSLTATGVMLGTYDYLSPEQARDSRSADVRSDLYSLGCTVFFMLTGQPPYPQGTPIEKIIQHSSEKRPRPSDYRADLPSGFDAMTSKLLAIDPADRYQRPAELIAEIQELASRNNIPLLGYDDNVVVKKIITRPSWTMQLVPVLIPIIMLLGFVFYLDWAGKNARDKQPGFTAIPLGGTDRQSPADANRESQPDPAVDLVQRESVGQEPMLRTPTGPESAISTPAGKEMRSKTGSDSAQLPVEPPSSDLKNSDFITVGASGSLPPGVSNYDDLESALEAVNNDPRLNEIRIYRDSLVLSQPVSVKVNQSLTISSAGENESMILFQPRGSFKPSFFRVRGGSVEFRNLHFRLETDPGMLEAGGESAVATLLELDAVNAVNFSGCSLTIDNFGDEGGRVLPDARFIAILPPRKNMAMFDIQPKETMTSKPSVTFRNFCIRGEADLLHLTESFPLTLSLNNGLLVTDGRVFDLGPAREVGRTEQNEEIEIYLTRFTSVSSQGFARMNAGAVGKPVPLRIVARQSIFNYGNATSFIQHENVAEGISRNKLLILKCQDSFFPQKNPLWGLSYLDQDLDAEQLDFSAMGDWLDVTGTVGDTAQVTWQSFDGLVIPPSEHTVFDYRLSGPFEKNPAIRREAGVNTENFEPIPPAFVE